jgi:hypothetical protein
MIVKDPMFLATSRNMGGIGRQSNPGTGSKTEEFLSQGWSDRVNLKTGVVLPENDNIKLIVSKKYKYKIAKSRKMEKKTRKNEDKNITLYQATEV